jgi:substrate-assisted peptide maturase DurN-like protein
LCLLFANRYFGTDSLRVPPEILLLAGSAAVQGGDDSRIQSRGNSMKVKSTGPKPDTDDPTKNAGIESVREIQHLLLLCSLLDPQGPLASVLRLALSVHEEPLLAHVRPMRDLHPRATKEWLERFWTRAGMSDAEEEMVAWQNEKPMMDAAVTELTNAERQLGVRLVPELLR